MVSVLSHFAVLNLESHVWTGANVFLLLLPLYAILYNDYATTDKKQSRVSEVDCLPGWSR